MVYLLSGASEMRAEGKLPQAHNGMARTPREEDVNLRASHSIRMLYGSYKLQPKVPTITLALHSEVLEVISGLHCVTEGAHLLTVSSAVVGYVRRTLTLHYLLGLMSP